MNSYRQIATVALLVLASADVSSSVVREVISAGPVSVEFPRAHQGIVLERVYMSLSYSDDSNRPSPFSSFERIFVSGDLVRGDSVQMMIHVTESCKESEASFSGGMRWQGTRCWDWDDGLYVAIEFSATFEGVSSRRVHEYLNNINITLRGVPAVTRPLVSE